MDAITLIKKHEGYRSKVYVCSEGKETIAYGRNVSPTGPGISEDEAEYMLRNDIDKCKCDLIKQAPYFLKLDEVRRGVLINMRFQLGLRGLLGFRKFLAAMSVGDYIEAANEMLDSRWARQTPERALQLAEMVRSGEWPNSD